MTDVADHPLSPPSGGLPPRRLSRAQLVAVDAVLVALSGISGVLNPTDEGRLQGPGWHAVAITAWVVMSVGVLFRRRTPRAALVVVVVAAVVGLVLHSDAPAANYVSLTVYSVVIISTRVVGVRYAVGGVVLVGAATIAGGGHQWLVDALSEMIGVSLGWVAGEYMRSGRRYAQLYAEFQEAKVAAAEERRAEQVERAAAEERVNLARELHDIVAHGMSVIAVRAGVARMVIDTQPDQAAAALSIIETTTRKTLQEMRLLVGVLRRNDEVHAELAPAPGLADLDRLVADIELAGVVVDLTVGGTPRKLPSAVDLSAYRIVQEALTNVVRHAAPTTAHVRLAFGATTLTIDVQDEGRREGSAPVEALAKEGTGHGLIGIRERAALFHGSMTACSNDQGFHLRAVLTTSGTCRSGQ